ncbi:MAG: carboxymuconolactone decarboxylase family protein [Desulfovibrio sp.]|nr:MAG: carboxymuconolactone decarboxylase family protein [Desulfovibrio sp.]
MENQSALRESTSSNWKKFRELMPDVAQAYDELPGVAYSGGSLDAKTKRIMAIAIAVACGCRACMLFQTERALDLGATAEEILEACSVAISLGGTMAGGETTRVVQYLSELGKI